MEKITFEGLPEAVNQIHHKISSIEKLLLSQTNHSPETDQLLTIKQASELITLSVPTIYGLVQRSAIPVSKQGKRLYFSRIDLINWIRTGRRKTIAEIISEGQNFESNKRKGGMINA